MAKENKEEKRTICKVVKYEKDIKPFPLVKIYSGVGSGKSYFATKMITGSDEYEIPEHNILIITSRRSKVEETLQEMKGLVKHKISKDGNLSYDIWESGETEPEAYKKYLKEIKVNVPDFGDITFSQYNQSAVCTNAFVSAYLRYVYEPDNPMTHIWNKFDAIIIDEVHSLITDATYQPATFDVLAFIKEYLRLSKENLLQESACKHMILMTGTPQPFETYADLDFPEELTHEIRLFDKCENVVPKNIILIDETTSRQRIQELMSNGEKAIYFSNHTMTETDVKKKFALSDVINVGVSFSKEEKRKSLPKEEYNKIKSIEESLADNSLIPEDIQLFVTTSRNKEGININNTDYNNMFVETHLMYDVVQMAGRVRSGIDNLYIITDSEPFSYGSNYTDKDFSKKKVVANKDCENSDDEANKYLKEEYFENKIEQEKSCADRRKNRNYYVKYIEDRFSYVRFNVFRQKFEYFYKKEQAEQMANLQVQSFTELLESDNNEYIKSWFPNSEVIRELTTQERAKVYLNSIIGTKKSVIISKQEQDNVRRKLQGILATELTSINPLLKLVHEDYHCVRSGKGYFLYFGKEAPRIKKKGMGKGKKH